MAALSGSVDPAALARGVEALSELGFEPILATNLLSRHGLFAGSDEERLEGFHRLVADESLAAIVFARGGHGVLRLLPHLDWDRIGQHPRAYVGYSDLTPLLNLVVRRLGLVAFHGPMVAADLARGLTGEEAASFLRALGGEFGDVHRVAGHGESVEGVLVGGCLSLLAAVAGTEYAVLAEDDILFWEDVEEPMYRVDRMLTQLWLSGSLTGIRGMVVGRLEPDRELGEDELLAGLLAEWQEAFACPVAYGVRSGHAGPNLTLPLGLKARLEPERGVLSFPGADRG